MTLNPRASPGHLLPAIAALEQAGDDVVRISRSLGVDLITGDGLDAALTGVDAVVDATSYETADRDDAVASRHRIRAGAVPREERRQGVVGMAKWCGADRPPGVRGVLHYAKYDAYLPVSGPEA